MPKTVVKTTYSTLEQAENEVYRLVESGTNYREISQIAFSINDTSKKFSISQISKIKKKLSGENNPKLDKTKSDSEQIAFLFELFQNGMTVVDVIIKTKLDSKFVNEAFLEYSELNGDCVIPKMYLNQLKKSLGPLDKKHGIDDVYDDPCNIITVAGDYLALLERE